MRTNLEVNKDMNSLVRSACSPVEFFLQCFRAHETKEISSSFTTKRSSTEKACVIKNVTVHSIFEFLICNPYLCSSVPFIRRSVCVSILTVFQEQFSCKLSVDIGQPVYSRSWM